MLALHMLMFLAYVQEKKYTYNILGTRAAVKLETNFIQVQFC